MNDYKKRLDNLSKKNIENSKVEHESKPLQDFYPEPKPRRMKKILNSISKTIAGENKAGEAIHGVLDLLPIPNQVIAKAFSYLTSGEPRKAKGELKKLVSFRNIVAIIAFIGIVTGLVTVEDIRNILQLLGELS